MIYYLATYGTLVTLGYLVGYAIGSGATVRRTDRHRRQVADQMLAVAAARPRSAAEVGSRHRHPSARPLTGQAAVDQWLAENYGRGA